MPTNSVECNFDLKDEPLRQYETNLEGAPPTPEKKGTNLIKDCTKSGNCLGHSIFSVPPPGGLLEIPYPSEVYFKVFPLGIFKSFVILGLQTPRNITFTAEAPLDLFLVDFETIRILTSFESQKEATLEFSLKMAIWEPLGFTLPWGRGIKNGMTLCNQNQWAVRVSPTKVTG